MSQLIDGGVVCERPDLENFSQIAQGTSGCRFSTRHYMARDNRTEGVPMNAFESWLLKQNRITAITHVIECLRSGGEQAWELMERVNGPDWSCPPTELPKTVNDTLNALKELEPQ